MKKCILDKLMDDKHTFCLYSLSFERGGNTYFLYYDFIRHVHFLSSFGIKYRKITRGYSSHWVADALWIVNIHSREEEFHIYSKNMAALGFERQRFDTIMKKMFHLIILVNNRSKLRTII